MLWTDTVASSRRFFYGLALLFPAVLVGLHMGVFPYFGVFFLRFILFFDKIIALSRAAHPLHRLRNRRTL